MSDKYSDPASQRENSPLPGSPLIRRSCGAAFEKPVLFQAQVIPYDDTDGPNSPLLAYSGDNVHIIFNIPKERFQKMARAAVYHLRLDGPSEASPEMSTASNSDTPDQMSHKNDGGAGSDKSNFTEVVKELDADYTAEIIDAYREDSDESRDSSVNNIANAIPSDRNYKEITVTYKSSVCDTHAHCNGSVEFSDESQSGDVFRKGDNVHNSSEKVDLIEKEDNTLDVILQSNDKVSRADSCTNNGEYYKDKAETECSNTGKIESTKTNEASIKNTILCQTDTHECEGNTKRKSLSECKNGIDVTEQEISAKNLNGCNNVNKENKNVISANLSNVLHISCEDGSGLESAWPDIHPFTVMEKIPVAEIKSYETTGAMTKYYKVKLPNEFIVIRVCSENNNISVGAAMYKENGFKYITRPSDESAALNLFSSVEKTPAAVPGEKMVFESEDICKELDESSVRCSENKTIDETVIVSQSVAIVNDSTDSMHTNDVNMMNLKDESPLSLSKGNLSECMPLKQPETSSKISEPMDSANVLETSQENSIEMNEALKTNDESPNSLDKRTEVEKSNDIGTLDNDASAEDPDQTAQDEDVKTQSTESLSHAIDIKLEKGNFLVPGVSPTERFKFALNEALKLESEKTEEIAPKSVDALEKRLHSTVEDLEVDDLKKINALMSPESPVEAENKLFSLSSNQISMSSENDQLKVEVAVVNKALQDSFQDISYNEKREYLDKTTRLSSNFDSGISLNEEASKNLSKEIADDAGDEVLQIDRHNTDITEHEVSSLNNVDDSSDETFEISNQQIENSTPDKSDIHENEPANSKSNGICTTKNEGLDGIIIPDNTETDFREINNMKIGNLDVTVSKNEVCNLPRSSINVINLEVKAVTSEKTVTETSNCFEKECNLDLKDFKENDLVKESELDKETSKDVKNTVGDHEYPIEANEQVREFPKESIDGKNLFENSVLRDKIFQQENEEVSLKLSSKIGTDNCEKLATEVIVNAHENALSGKIESESLQTTLKDKTDHEIPSEDTDNTLLHPVEAKKSPKKSNTLHEAEKQKENLITQENLNQASELPPESEENTDRIISEENSEDIARYEMKSEPKDDLKVEESLKAVDKSITTDIDNTRKNGGKPEVMPRKLQSSDNPEILIANEQTVSENVEEISGEFEENGENEILPGMESSVATEFEISSSVNGDENANESVTGTVSEVDTLESDEIGSVASGSDDSRDCDTHGLRKITRRNAKLLQSDTDEVDAAPTRVRTRKPGSFLSAEVIPELTVPKNIKSTKVSDSFGRSSIVSGRVSPTARSLRSKSLDPSPQSSKATSNDKKHSSIIESDAMRRKRASTPDILSKKDIKTAMRSSPRKLTRASTLSTETNGNSKVQSTRSSVAETQAKSRSNMDASMTSRRSKRSGKE